MKLAKEFVNNEHFVFRRFQVDAKKSNVLFNGEKNKYLCFLQLEFLLVKS
jgi:hypothetical protein